MSHGIKEIYWGNSESSIQLWLEKTDKSSLLSRIWKKDATVWKKEVSHQKEISNRLGWLEAPTVSKMKLNDILAFAEEIKKEDYKYAVLIGMGGSSLAPEVFSLTFGSKEGFPKLIVMDSTDPLRIKDIEALISNKKTLFIVSSKSGSTIELMSLFKYFYLKSNQSGKNFIAITDPGTALEDLAKKSGFRKIFLGQPDVGGRFSALTVFGLVPAALLGVDVSKIIENAEKMRQLSQSSRGLDNPAMALGLGMAVLADEGRDKLTILLDKPLTSLGDWIEQLVAESTGKEEVGIVPILDEALDENQEYSKDRFFVAITLASDAKSKTAEFLKTLRTKAQPYIHIELKDVYTLAGEFFRWEMATAIACSLLKIDAFDQPDVQAAKDSAKTLLKSVEEGKELRIKMSDMDLVSFWEDIREGDYVAILAFLPDRKEIRQKLVEIRQILRAGTNKPVTLGFGPRYLHSTGQLHKGGANSALFLLITTKHPEDMEVPGNKYTFGELEMAQAMGDLRALESKGRAVYHLRLNQPTDAALALASEQIKNSLSAISSK